MRVLVTGPTGYIGGRLTARLLEEGHTVRILVRDPSRVAGRAWADRVEVVHGDLLDPDSIRGLTDEIDVAYYLVHAMHAGKGFARLDRVAAANFTAAAPKLKHVHLPRRIAAKDRGGLEAPQEPGRDRGASSPSTCPTTELRAGPIIGSGSASFEMLPLHHREAAGDAGSILGKQPDPADRRT